MGGRLQRAKFNAASTLVHQLVSTLCGMIIPWVMIDTFGSAAYGATTSIAQFLAYISLFEGGIGRVARGALYKPLAERNDRDISRVYFAVKRFFTIIGSAFAVYAVVLAFGYFDIADVEVFTREYTFFLVLSIALGKFAEYMGGISNITLLNADQRQYVVNSAYIVTNVLNALLIAVLAKSGVGILWVKLVSSFVFVLRPLFYTLYLKKHYGIKKTKERASLPNKFTGVAQHMAYVVQNNTDVLILTVCADLEVVAVYAVYHLVVFSMRNIATAFVGGMEAVFGDMIAKGEDEKLRRNYRRYKWTLTVLTVMLFSATAILIVPFIRLYTARVSDADYMQPLFACVLVLSEVLNCLILPCFNLTIAANRLRESQLGAYGEAAVNLTVSIALVFWNPLLGVALGTLCSAVFKCVYYLIFSCKHILKMPVRRGARDMLVVVGVMVPLVIGGGLFMEQIATPHYGIWAFWSVVVALVTGAVGVLIGHLLYPEATKVVCGALLKRPCRSQKEVTSLQVTEQTHDIAAYAAYLTDDQALLASSSGGVATALAHAVIAKGGHVAGVAYSEDFSAARYEIAHTAEELDRFKGSKYIDVQKGTVYKDVQALLERGETVLFIGLPCTVAALYAFLKKDYAHLLTVELICHGPTDAKVHRDYTAYLEKKYQSRLVDFSVKRKKDGWTPGYLYAAFENGQEIYENFYHTAYGYAFSVMAKKPCYTCNFRGDDRTGDLMIGDFWGAVPEDPFWNAKGVSAVLVHSEKGLSWLKATDGLQLYETTAERIVQKNPNVLYPRSKRPETDKFARLLAEHDLFYAVKHSKRWTTRIKALLKSFVKH
ncbi:MAG: hypothetical protein E7552_05325 [Ruminococcaceae bacterium]|nr:hypothetical protein [Oscillospiraceae bacterium]